MGDIHYVHTYIILALKFFEIELNHNFQSSLAVVNDSRKVIAPTHNFASQLYMLKPRLGLFVAVVVSFR